MCSVRCGRCQQCRPFHANFALRTHSPNLHCADPAVSRDASQRNRFTGSSLGNSYQLICSRKMKSKSSKGLFSARNSVCLQLKTKLFVCAKNLFFGIRCSEKFCQNFRQPCVRQNRSIRSTLKCVRTNLATQFCLTF